MIKIDLTNYEAFFIDHLEGNLNDKETAMLMNFLNQYPELKAELEDFETITLSSETTLLSPSFKSQLKKEESTGLNRKDYLLIANIEGQLSDEEKMELDQMEKAYPGIDKEKQLYAHTILKPNLNAVYVGKSNLKRKGTVVVLFQRAAAIAAVLLVAFLLSQLIANDPLYKPNLADISKIPSSNESTENSILENFVIKEMPANESKELHTLPESQEIPSQNFYAQIEEKIEEDQKHITEDMAATANIEEKAPAVKDSVVHSKEDAVNFDDQYANADGIEDPTEQTIIDEKEKAEFVPVSDFARQRIKKDILKNKTLSEAIADEIAKATNDKVTFDQVINSRGKREKFALNIGKLKISKNN